MFLRNDVSKSGIKFCVLSRAGGGGACVAKTNKALLVGVWTVKDTPTSKGTQNTGDCEKNVLAVADLLYSAGYWKNKLNYKKADGNQIKSFYIGKLYVKKLKFIIY